MESVIRFSFHGAVFVAVDEKPVFLFGEHDVFEKFGKTGLQSPCDFSQNGKRRYRAEVFDFGQQPGGQPGTFREFLQCHPPFFSQFPYFASECNQLFSHSVSLFLLNVTCNGIKSNGGLKKLLLPFMQIS